MQVSRINYNDFIAEKSVARRGSHGNPNHKSVGTQAHSVNATPKYSSYVELNAYRGPKNFRAPQKSESVSSNPNNMETRPRYELNVIGDSNFTSVYKQPLKNKTQTKLEKEIQSLIQESKDESSQRQSLQNKIKLPKFTRVEVPKDPSKKNDSSIPSPTRNSPIGRSSQQGSSFTLVDTNDIVRQSIDGKEAKNKDLKIIENNYSSSSQLPNYDKFKLQKHGMNQNS